MIIDARMFLGHARPRPRDDQKTREAHDRVAHVRYHGQIWQALARRIFGLDILVANIILDNVMKIASLMCNTELV